MGKIKKVVLVNVYAYFGGTLAISKLCAELRKQQVDARLLMVPYFPDKPIDTAVFKKEVKTCILKNRIKKGIMKIFPFIDYSKNKRFKHLAYFPVKGVKFEHCVEIDDETLVVYPEIVYGNPLGAKNVARWLLYHYKFENTPEAYRNDDLFMCYRTYFNSPTLNPKGITVTINHFDDKLYRQYNFGKRTGNCYILRKGRNRTDLPKEFDGPVFDDNMSQEELVKMFNTYKYCYDYDTQTFYATIAAVCGCIPIVVMEPGKTIDDYLSKAEQNHYGRAYGDSPEQIEYAVRTRDKLLAALDYSERNHKSTAAFIEAVEERFGQIKRMK